MERTLVVTGHRPRHLGNSTVAIEAVLDAYLATWEHSGGHRLMHGGAIGTDLMVAELALRREWEVITVVPCRDQTVRWSPDWLRRYEDVCQRSHVVLVGEGPCTSEAYLRRNRWMVDQGQQVLACWNGEWTSGTGATIRYAQRHGVPVIAIHPHTLQLMHLNPNM